MAGFIRRVAHAGPAIWLALIFAGYATGAVAQDRVKLVAQDMSGYGRVIVTFPLRNDLPVYRLLSENGVLAMEFDTPVQLELPDISGALEPYVTVARMDPDRKGFRIGLKGAFRIHQIEAGEKLFLDILPGTWQGTLPGLPQEVIGELSRRAKDAAIDAERKRKAELLTRDPPTVELRVGRHPTFVRMVFDWSTDITASYSFAKPTGVLSFSLPLAIDLYEIKTAMPPEILDIRNKLTADGNNLTLTLAEGVVPRFYEGSRREFMLDIDSLEAAESNDINIADLLPQRQDPVASDNAQPDNPEAQIAAESAGQQVLLTPTIETKGSTVRMVFPFESDTAAAVFRRGDMVWMIFDTGTRIVSPDENSGLESIASSFDVVSAGETEIVRLKLDNDRLATLASEGRAWVLSLGDVLLSATQPLKLSREQDESGVFSIAANLENPGKVHELRDPEVGDILEVVTAFPPSRALIRPLDFVEFSALRSVHGLVVRPAHEAVRVSIDEGRTIISAEAGLIVSAPQSAHATDSKNTSDKRAGFIDLAAYLELDQARLYSRIDEVMNRVSKSDRRLLDPSRLDLSRLYLANQLPYEAIGVLEVLQKNLSNKDMEPEVRLTLAAADVSAGRPEEALKILRAEDMASRVDALMWRAIAYSQVLDFKSTRLDALAAEPVIAGYPGWVQVQFLMAGIEAGLETGDYQLAGRFLAQVDTAFLSIEQLSRFELLSARMDEVENRFDEALDTYGKVIAADVRPTRAEAIYRTLLLLDRMGRLDPLRASETLASEAMIWRGDDLEARMLKLLAELFFRANDFRAAFEVVHRAAVAHPTNPAIENLLSEATATFADLYLNGQADALGPVEALTLYYDYREFTPPGARGDEMVRNLARRLIKVDLLDQAAELLEYQVENRLEGVAKSQIAADLAIIQIANRNPEGALKALNISRVSGLPPALERQRRVLESRALVDAGREDLALDLLSTMDGRDADLLRVDAHWRAKRYREASELLELLYSNDQSNGEMTRPARSNIVKAAVGFVLANDRIGLSRLRSKFGERMSATPEWSMFDFVTGSVSSNSLEFRQVAQEVASLDSLNAFLKSYRDVYAADGALAPTNAVQSAGSSI